MKIIKPSVEFFGTVPTDYNSAIKFIEMAGRTCCKSEEKITEISAEGFVKKLINAGHLAMVEHSNFVVRRSLIDMPKHYSAPVGKFHAHHIDGNYLYIGGNLTAWFQSTLHNGPDAIFEPFCTMYGKLFGNSLDVWKDDLCYWKVCPHDQIPKELHRYSAKFICDRGVSHELVRHRPCSFAQESTRYVNYGGKDVEFIEPAGFMDWPQDVRMDMEDSFRQAERDYKLLISKGLKPQQARAVLPNALKTEIIVTADAAEWRHIRALRTSKAAHPDIQRVMAMMPWEELL